MTDDQRQALDNIMDWFDFEKVHKTMRALRWEWSGTEQGIPCMGESREKARQMLTDSIEQEVNIGSGGFQVTYNSTEGFLKLEFVISEWDALM